MKEKVQKTQKQINNHTKNREQNISSEIESTDTPNSQEYIENNDIEREENVTLQKQEITLEKKYYLKFHRKTY